MWVPAANHYKPVDKLVSPKVKGNYLQKEVSGSVIGDAIAHGKSVPANNLKLHSLELTKPKAPATDFQTTKLVRFKPDKKTDLSPTSYKPEAKLVKPRSISFTQPKSKLNTFATQHAKIKAFVPSPVAYNPDKADKIITLGARKGYK